LKTLKGHEICYRFYLLTFNSGLALQAYISTYSISSQASLGIKLYSYLPILEAEHNSILINILVILPMYDDFTCYKARAPSARRTFLLLMRHDGTN